MNRMNLLVHCRYERFVIALEEASRDMLPILKDKALKVCGPDMPCTSQFLILSAGVYISSSTYFHSFIISCYVVNLENA